MTTADAKRTLIAHRPGREDFHDAEVAAALARARHDPALGEWLEAQHRFHRAMEQALCDAPVPPALRERIISRAKILRVPFWRRSVTLAAAAAIVLLVGLSVLWRREPGGDAFPVFRSRMVGAVLRQYTMDIETNDMAQIRRFLASRNAPADYVLSENLSALPASGAGVLRWRDAEVSMVCLDSQSRGTLFLFVVDQSQVKGPPGSVPEFAQVNRLMTVSWTESGKTYVLAGNGNQEWLEQQR
jgi:hypothetical protein